jgi:hypothetical protein
VVIQLPCFRVTLARVTHRKLQIFEYFQDVYVRDDSQEDFVVDNGGEDSFTVSLIQLEEETVEQDILALDTQKDPGPDGIFPLMLKKIVLDVTACCFV